MNRERTTTRLYNAEMATQPVLNVRRNTIRKNTQILGLQKPEVGNIFRPSNFDNQDSGDKRMEWNKEKGSPDMIKLDEYTIPALMKNLLERYDAERYYTYCGNILVAINPYYALQGYYTQSIIKQYNSKAFGEEPPHIFAVADNAYRTVVNDKKNVSVVISGESGAGKTETTKLILNYLSALNNEPSPMEAKIIESAALLEAFGNARTVRNKNSSRFGKYIKIAFTQSFKIAGAQIESYLLEKSRVSLQGEGERNFHIFYQLCQGASTEEKKKYFLKPASEFKITKILVDNGADEVSEFRDTKDAMALFGLDAKTQDLIFRICSVILHLGEVDFINREPTAVANDEEVKIAANMLQINPAALSKILVTKFLKIGAQNIEKGLKKAEAEIVRDSICRDLYSRLFDWIIRLINKSLSPEKEVNELFLGILDIFGFENFKLNSFEQMCINFANEKLHQQFIEHVFKLEQKEYAKEGISFNTIETKDNQPCLDLIEAKFGIISILDEETRLASSNDKTLVSKLNQSFKANQFYEAARLDPNSFIVKHYAEPVTYFIEGFRVKNQNTIEDNILSLIKGSANPLIKNLFPEQQEVESNQNKKAQTIASIFRTQLNNLKTTLDKTVPFYVRCIKPNLQQKAQMFDTDMIFKQLSYSGMVETVKIRAMGYPVRYDFSEFIGKFKVMGLSPNSKGSDIQKLLEKAKVDKKLHQIGRTKVFLKAEANDRLDKIRDALLRKYAIKLQAFARMVKWKKWFQRSREAAKVIQRNFRVFRKNKRLKRKVLLALKVAEVCELKRQRDRKLKREQEEKRRREEEERKRKEEELRRKKEEELRKRKEEEELKQKQKLEGIPVDSLEPMRESIRESEKGVMNDIYHRPRNTRVNSSLEKPINQGSNNNGKNGTGFSTSPSFALSPRGNQGGNNNNKLEKLEDYSIERYTSSIGDELSEEVRTKLRKIDELVIPESEEDIKRMAKGLQNKVKGQKPAVADKLYCRSVDLYKIAIEKSPTQDNYINCGTALINWACLKLVMPIYKNKEEACMQLLENAQYMLEKALGMELDQEGRVAVQERLGKVENIKQKVLEEDLKNIGTKKKQQMIEELTNELNRIKPVSMIGKLKKQGGGTKTFGRKSWKDRVFVLTDKHIRYYAKSANDAPKGEIPLMEVTGVKQCKIPGKEFSFAVTTINRFYPVVGSSEREMREWMNAINDNLNRLKLLSKLDSYLN